MSRRQLLDIAKPALVGAFKTPIKTIAVGTLVMGSTLLLAQPQSVSASTASLQDEAEITVSPSPASPSLGAQNVIAQNALAELATAEEILAEINWMRESPQQYAAWLMTLRDYYSSGALRIPNERGIRTVEGIAALEGAISALSSRQPVPPLALAPGLVQSTQGHLNELLTHNRFTLAGLDGSTPLERAERYGSLGNGRLNELLNEGFRSADSIVASLVIDDGNRSRSTQDALLNADITSLGIACDMGVNGKPLCVIDYATEYETSSQLAAAKPSDVSSQFANQTLASRATGSTSAGPEIDSDIWFGEPAPGQLTTLADELIIETNKLRANPAAYAEKLIRLRPYYEANLVRVPGHPVVQVTEGVAALDEAIAVLQQTPALGVLSASDGMALGANDHAQDLGARGQTGHYGSDGSDPFARINRYGKWDYAPGNVAGENITYGQATLAEWHIIQLLVDDNVPSRGHREALLKPNYERVGSACQAHPDFRIVCVMTYASDYQEGR